MRSFGRRVLNYEVQLNELISVSKQDEFISSIDKWNAHSNSYLAKNTALPHRAFSIFLFNSKNQLLMQKRSQEKKTFPLCWTNTCCSHPNMIKLQNGTLGQQPIRQSLHRALWRQFRLDLGQSPFYFMNKILYKQQGAGGANDFGQYEVDYVYLNKLPTQSIKYQDVPQQVADTTWIKQNEMNQFVSSTRGKGGLFSPWFLKMHESGLLNQWWNMIKNNDLKNQPGQNVFKTTHL